MLEEYGCTVPFLFYVYFEVALYTTVEKMKFSIKDFFRNLRIWSHLLKKSLMENFIFCAVYCIRQSSVKFL